MKSVSPKELERLIEASSLNAASLSSEIKRGPDYVRDYLVGRKKSFKQQDWVNIFKALAETLPESEMPALIKLSGGLHTPLTTGGVKLHKSMKRLSDKLGAIPVIGKVQAGGWLDIEDVENAEAYHMDTVPGATNYPIEWQYAFDVVGNSINRVANEGDRLICLDLAKSGTGLPDIEDNELVIVEFTKHSGLLIQRTAKRLRRTSSGFDLWPDSTDSEFQTPIAMNGVAEGESVRVMAKVLWIMKKP